MKGRLVLAAMAAVMIAAGVLYAVHPLRPVDRPTDATPLARWLVQHPADWAAAGALSDQALDASLPDERRFALWRKAYAHAHRLAPLRLGPQNGFARAGLFHWYELDAADRRAVLAATKPLLQSDRDRYGEMVQPLWNLTHDFAYLRSAMPDDEQARYWLSDLAVQNGLFQEYQSLRDEIRRRRLELFRANAPTLPPTELLRFVPNFVTTADEPLLVAILQELHRRPPESNRGYEPHTWRLIDYAVRHHLQPLDGLEPLARSPVSTDPATRARLLLAVGDTAGASRLELAAADSRTRAWRQYHVERGDLSVPHPPTRPIQWDGLCGANEMCAGAQADVWAEAPTTLPLQLNVVQSDEIPPWVEVYVDDRLVTEFAVRGRANVDVMLASVGAHRLELRVANPRTRNGVTRRLAV